MGRGFYFLVTIFVLLYLHSFLRLNNIPLCVIPHFVYPFICWWTLGCFHLLGIMNNAALNFSVQISVQVPAFNSFEYILWSGLAGSYANFMFNFLRNCHPFSTVATPFHISISIAQGLQFLHILANTYLLALFVFVFDYGHLNGYSPFFKIYFSYC